MEGRELNATVCLPPDGTIGNELFPPLDACSEFTLLPVGGATPLDEFAGELCILFCLPALSFTSLSTLRMASTIESISSKSVPTKR